MVKIDKTEVLHTREMLKEMQQWPLAKKIQVSKARIIEFAEKFDNKICVSFSGGKDSTVLLHLVRSIYPNVPAVFTNTGLEYPEIQKFVRHTPGAELLTPKMRFPEVITQYGYPLISKEVSEAIYYARRKSPREREREREHNDAQSRSSRIISKGRIYKGIHAEKKQQEFLGIKRGSSESLERLSENGWNSAEDREWRCL